MRSYRPHASISPCYGSMLRPPRQRDASEKRASASAWAATWAPSANGRRRMRPSGCDSSTSASWNSAGAPAPPASSAASRASSHESLTALACFHCPRLWQLRLVHAARMTGPVLADFLPTWGRTDTALHEPPHNTAKMPRFFCVFVV